MPAYDEPKYTPEDDEPEVVETDDDEDDVVGPGNWRKLLFPLMLTFTTFWRWCFFHYHRNEMRRRRYAPDSKVPGYTGWIEHPVHQVIAFERADGRLQFRW